MSLDEVKSREELLEELQDLRQRLARLEPGPAAPREQAPDPAFSDFFDTACDPASFLDTHYVYQAVNAAYERYFSMPRDEIIGKSVAEIHGRERFETMVKPNLDRCLAGEAVVYEAWFQFPSMGRRCMNVAYTPRTNSRGEVVGILHISRDLTLQKTMELQIQKERDKLSGILSSLNTGLSLINPDLTVDWVNEQTRRMFPEGEPVGSICHKFYENHDTPCPDCGTIKAFQEGHAFRSERHHPVDGRWYAIFAQPLLDDEGAVVQVLEGITDITAQKQTEEALRNNEERFRRFADNATDAFFIADADGRILDVNAQAVSDTGYSRHELLEMQIWDVDDTVSPEAFLEQWSTLPEGRRQIFETTHRRKDGTRYPVELNATKFNENGKTYLFGIARDLSERKRAEAEALAIIETTFDGFWVVNMQGRIIQANDAACALLGYSMQELLQLHIWDIDLQESPEDSYTRMQQLIAQGGGRFETRHVLNNGEIMAAEVSASYLPHDGGKFFVFTRDITQRKETSERLMLTQTSVDKAALSVFWINPQGFFVYVNDTACSHLGYSREQLQGMAVWDVDPDFPRERRAETWKNCKEQGVLRFTTRHRTSDGRILPMQLTSTYMAYKGEEYEFAYAQDISELAASEKELRLANQRLREAQRIGSIGDWAWDSATDTVTWSDNLYVLMGLDPDKPPPNYEGQLALYHPEDASRLRQAVQQALEHGTPYELEMSRTKPDGAITHFLVRGVADFDATGAVTGLHGSVLDITDRKRAEQTLRLHSLALSNISDLVTVTDPQGMITFVNNAVCQMLGRPFEDIVGQPVQILGDDPASGASQQEIVQQTLLTGQWRGEVTNYAQDGTAYILDCRTSLIVNDKGEPMALCGISTDITERKRTAEILGKERQRLADILRGTNVGTWEWNVQTGETVFNERWAEMVGYRLAELSPTSIETWASLTHPEDLARSDELLQQHFRGELDYYECEARMRHKNGHWIWVLDRGKVAQWTEDGRPLLVSGTHQDITQRKQDEEVLRKAIEEAEAANKAKSLFLANMSHELRTPLNGIIGMHQLLKTTPLDFEQCDYVDKAINSARRLTNLLGDILDLSKIEAGKMSVAARPFDLRQTLELVRQLFSLPCEQKGLELRFHVHDSLPNTLTGDAARLQQILNNLVGNAVKFTESGTIEVEAYPLPGNHGHPLRILFSVADSGIGIPDEKQDRLFNAFTQADEGHSRKYQGAGLGLAIVKQLATLMGGNVSIASQPGTGTCVHFCLPFRQAPALEGKECETAATLEHSLEGLAILLAEDDQVNRFSVQRQLEKAGCRVVCVENGQQALDALRKQRFDLVLMDIQMPVMDGVQATRAIREGRAGKDRKNTPVIALTAYAMVGDKERFLKEGLNGYLAKPVSFDALLAAMRKELQRG